MLITDAALGANSIEVDDVETNFPDGGQLVFENDEVYSFTLPDTDDTNHIIDLTTPLASAHTAGEFVAVYPKVIERYMDVMQPNSDEVGRIRVPHQLRPFVWEGIRADGEEEYVEVDHTTSDVKLQDIPGTLPRFDADVVDTTIGVPRDRVPPASSPTPVVVGGPGFLWIDWDEVANQDPVTYDVHLDTVNGFTPDDATTLVASVVGTGYIAKQKHDGSALAYGTTYYVKIVARDPDGKAPASAQASAQMVKLPSSEQATDGSAPPAATAPTVKGGPTFLVATWPVVSNADPVTYEVHVSTASGFTPSGSTKYAETKGESIIIKTTAAGGALAYGTTYYVKIVAKDADGSAAASGQGSASMVQITGASGGDIQAGTIIGGDIAALTITGGLVAASTLTADKLSVTTLSSITANVGTLTAGTIDASGVSVINLNATNITAGTLAAARIGAASIDASKLNVAQLSAIAADLGTITAGTITGATIQTAASGQRTVIDGAGLRAYDSGGAIVVNLPNTGSPTFTGTIRTTDMIVTGGSNPPGSALGWEFGGGGLGSGPRFTGRIGTPLTPPSQAVLTSIGAQSTATPPGNSWLQIGDDRGSSQPVLNAFVVGIKDMGAYTFLDGTGKSIFVQMTDVGASGAGGDVADLSALNTITGTGVAARTAANSWATRNITASTGISVSNPAGIAGDPTISIDTSIVPRLSTVNVYTNRQVFAPATDVPSLDLRRGTDTSPTANILRLRRADDTASLLTIDAFGHVNADAGIETKVVAGAVSDANFGNTPGSGAIAVDTTNSRVYFRVGSTWKFVGVGSAPAANFTLPAYSANRTATAPGSVTLSELARTVYTLIDDLKTLGELK